MSKTTTGQFSALVLAGDRRADDPLLRAGQVASKVLLPVAGMPMVLRVLEALEQSRYIEHRWLCGPPAEILAEEARLQALIDSGQISWLAGDTTPSRSASQGLAVIPSHQPVLLTTADHALLNATMVDYFCQQALTSEADVLVALTPYPGVRQAFPGVRRTVLRLDQGYCGCNLFAFMTPRGRVATDYWQRIEALRKHPLRMLANVGWWPALRYALGHLDLDAALAVLSKRLGAKAAAVLMPFPEASVDVDTPQDWQFVESLARERSATASSC